jgi:hypothetical protein
MSRNHSRSQRRLLVWTAWCDAVPSACRGTELPEQPAACLTGDVHDFTQLLPFPSQKLLCIIRLPFFRDVTQRRTVVTDISGQNIVPIFLQMGPTGCPETSANSHHSTLRETLVERRAQKCLFNEDIKSCYCIVSMERCWSDAMSKTEGL